MFRAATTPPSTIVTIKQSNARHQIEIPNGDFAHALNATPKLVTVAAEPTLPVDNVPLRVDDVAVDETDDDKVDDVLSARSRLGSTSIIVTSVDPHRSTVVVVVVFGFVDGFVCCWAWLFNVIVVVVVVVVAGWFVGVEAMF